MSGNDAFKRTSGIAFRRNADFSSALYPELHTEGYDE